MEHHGTSWNIIVKAESNVEEQKRQCKGQWTKSQEDLRFGSVASEHSKKADLDFSCSHYQSEWSRIEIWLPSLKDYQVNQNLRLIPIGTHLLLSLVDANISKTSSKLACLSLAAQTFCNGKVQCWVFFWLLVVWVWKETDKFPLRSDLLAFSPRRCLACCAFSVFAVALAAEATLFDVDLSSLTKPPLWEPSFEEMGGPETWVGNWKGTAKMVLLRYEYTVL